MHQHQTTPAQKTKIEKERARRRSERQRLVDEHRRRIERLRRQLAEARRRRQRFWLLFLLAVLALQGSIQSMLVRSFTPWPPPDPSDTSMTRALTPTSSEWIPDPNNDYAPRPGSMNHVDGYSFEEWAHLADDRGIRPFSKAGLKRAWEADPERALFPQRYQAFDRRPFLSELMVEMKEPYWRQDAFAAIKLLAPVGTHKYLDEAYASDLGDLRQCLADRDHQIVSALNQRAILWEERKRKEAEEARKAKAVPELNDDEKKIEA